MRPRRRDTLLVDRKEAARQLGVCPGTVDALVKSGELDAIRIGRRVLFLPEALVRFALDRLERRRVASINRGIASAMVN